MLRSNLKNFFEFEISRQLTFWFIFSYLFLYVVGLIAVIGLSHTLWTDEHHFLRAIHYFYESTSLHHLKHYNELATPFTFLFYAWWAKLYALEIEWLRLGSLLIACLTYLSIYFLCRIYFTRWLSLLGMILLSINPYMLGLSFFVYTDMWAILATVLAIIMVIKQKFIWASLFMAIALWSRQYAVYQLAAICLYLFFLYFPNIKKMIAPISLMSLSFISLVPLFLLWGGFSPINEIRKVYLQVPIQYQWNGLWAYLAACTIYMAPLILIWLWYHPLNRRLLFLSAILSSLYFLNPIQPSECAVIASFDSIGFFDKLLHSWIHQTMMIDFIYYLAIVIQVYYLIHLFQICKKNNWALFTLLSVLMYLLIMPLSYIVWEKYILLLLPVYMIGLLQFILLGMKKDKLENV